MLFRSKYANYNVPVKGPAEDVFRDGIVMREPKILNAEFGQNGDNFATTDMPSEMGGAAADMRGFFFDSEAAQQQNEWTDAERVLVEEALERNCRPGQSGHGIHWAYVRPKPAEPWKGYDTHTVQKISTLARDLDAVDEALAYEHATFKRPGVIHTLASVREAMTEERELVETSVA